MQIGFYNTNDMEDFYREFRTKLVHEMGRIQSSLKELKVLVEEDKRLLERLRKKRSMKAEQREELLMEREIIERMHGYTSKITALAAQKEALKQEIMRKYQKKILLDLMEMDDQQEQLKLLDEMHIKAKEKAKVKEIEEKRRIIQDSRLKKLARTFTPVKSKAPEATNSKIKSKTPVHQQESTYSRSGTKSPVANFSTKHVKEEMAKKIEEKKKKVRESLAIADTNQKHSDHMYKRALKNYYGMEEVRFEMKSKRDREEVASVTFHPHINDKSRKIARDIPPFKERAYDKLEADRLKAINERSKSYMKGKGITDSSASEFKMGKEYHAHMYTKTMKWEIARRTALDSKREKETQYPDEDIRDRPRVMLKKSKEILAQVGYL